MFHWHNADLTAVKSSGDSRYPDFEDALPEAVFVRGVAAGTFEEVTLRLDVLHALGEMSVQVINSARVIERTVDKTMTSHLLNRCRVPAVPAWTFTSKKRGAGIDSNKMQSEFKTGA